MINKELIKLVRLITGEELIVETVKDSADELVFKNPIRVIVVPNRTNAQNPSIGFAPWNEFTDDDTFTVKKEHILVVMNPIKEFKEQYVKTFSKIITPTSSIIMPS